MDQPNRWAIASLVGASVFVLMLALVMTGAAASFDQDLSSSSRLTLDVAHFLAFTGTTSAVLALAILAAFYLAWKGRPWDVARVLTTPVLVAGSAFVVKQLVARERPLGALVESSSYSFPSGHATAGAGLAVLAIYFTMQAKPNRNVAIMLIAASALWALAQAAGRPALGVHFVSDVVAGLGLGLAVASLSLVGFAMVERRFKSATR